MPLTKPTGYTLLLENGSLLSPADATTYHAGSFSAAGATTNAAQRRVYIPRTGTIRACQLYFLNGGTLGSNETSTVSIRLNNTTDTTVSAAVTNDALSTTFSNSALGVAVVAGDYIELKWVTPTWATNPTSVRYSAVVFVEI